MDFTLLILLFVLLITIRCPIAYGMIIVSTIYLYTNGFPIDILVRKITGGIDSFPLLAVPLFLFAGNLMNTMGITDRIFAFASAAVRHIPGGLGHVNVLSSILFAGMSGSILADAGGLGTVEIKAMREEGYPDDFSAAVTAASALIGPIIPPSIVMVIYAFLVEESVGKLFLAGVIPGLMMGLFMMGLIYVFTKSGKYKIKLHKKASFSEVKATFKRAFLPIMAPFILVSGIVTGAFTPTEAGVVIVLYVLIIGTFYLKFNFFHILTAMKETTKMTAATLYIIAVSSVFCWMVAVARVPEKITNTVGSFISSPILVLLFIVILVLFLGMLMEGIPVMIVTIPAILPLVENFGIDPVQLGVVFVMTMMIGALTPPVGITLYLVIAIAEIRLSQFLKAVWPFYISILAVVILLVLFPPLTLWLPNLFF